MFQKNYINYFKKYNIGFFAFLLVLKTLSKNFQYKFHSILKKVKNLIITNNEDQLIARQLLFKEGFQIKGLKFLRQINRGSFGVVYQAISIKNSKQYAVKIEKNATKNPQLNFQYDAYNQFSHFLFNSHLKNNFFPQIYGFFSNNQYSFMVMQKLGKNLYQLSKQEDHLTHNFQIIIYALNMLRIIHFIHLCNFVYRDIKPQNFLSKQNKPYQLLLVDFGLCKKLQQKKQRLKNRQKGTLIGTARYASINSHQGKQITKIDDIESLSYLIIYLLKGKLPWQGLKIKSEREKNQQVLKIKRKITTIQLCQDLPQGIQDLVQYVRNFSKKQEIDYNFLISCLVASQKQYLEKQKIIGRNLDFVKAEQGDLTLKKTQKVQKSSQGSLNQSQSFKKMNKKSTKKPLIKREFLIKEDINDQFSQQLSSQNQQQNSKFAFQ